MKTQSKYARQSYLNSVIKSVADSDATIGTMSVLFAMAWHSEFDAPRVQITKPYIKLYTGLSLKTIKTSLRWLRSNGVIIVVSGETGGQGVWPTYEIHKLEKGGIGSPPFDLTVEIDKGGNGRSIQEKIVANTGVANAPHPRPSVTSSVIKSSISKSWDAKDIARTENEPPESDKTKKDSAKRILLEAGYELNQQGGIISREDD